MIKFNYNQDDLELMSRDRELITTEIHDVNDFYGQASLLKKYSNYSKPLKVVYEHSLPIHDLIWDVDKNCNFPVCFTSSLERFRVYKNQLPKKLIFNVGSVLNYAIKLTDPSFANNNFKCTQIRSGSIYFPSHSTHHIKASNNSDLVIKSIKSLPEIYQPVYVCMYWKDILNGDHENYLKHGIPVVSAGHIFDNLFYYRLYDILKNFKYTLGSAFGSFIFHAARSGCLVIFPKELKPIKDQYSINNMELVDNDFEKRVIKGKEFDDVVADLFSNHIESYSENQMQFIENYSSSKLLSPFRIKLLLILAEFLYFLQRIKNKLKRIF